MRDKITEETAWKIIDGLAKARKDQGLSHENLAKMIGMSRPAISFIESHKRMPSLLTCLKIAKALKIDLASLLTATRK